MSIKKLIYAFAFSFLSIIALAENPPLFVTEQDGSPSGVATKIRFSNGSVTKNGTVFDVGGGGSMSPGATYYVNLNPPALQAGAYNVSSGSVRGPFSAYGEVAISTGFSNNYGYGFHLYSSFGSKLGIFSVGDADLTLAEGAGANAVMTADWFSVNANRVFFPSDTEINSKNVCLEDGTNCPASGVSVYPATSTILANVGIAATTGTFTDPTASGYLQPLTINATNTSGGAFMRLNTSDGFIGLQKDAGGAGYIDSYPHSLTLQANEIISVVYRAGSTVMASFSPSGGNILNAISSTLIPAIINGAISQSANLTEWRVNGTAVSSVSANGAISAPSATIPTINSLTISASSITFQGNTFNTASKLIQADASAFVPNANLNPSSVTLRGNTQIFISSYSVDHSVANSAVYTNYISVPITTGTWNCSASMGCNKNGGAATYFDVALSTYSGNTTTDHLAGWNLNEVALASGISPVMAIPAYHIVAPANITLYLKAYTNNTGALIQYGNIQCLQQLTP